MSYEVLIEAALKRQQAFRNLRKYLRIIKEAAERIDPEAETYLFGSVAEGQHVYSSDIDVLIATRAEPGRVRLQLWQAGIRDPFEVHVQPPDLVDSYRRRTKLVKVE